MDSTLNAPRVDLCDWRILSTDAGSSHFVGCRVNNGHGRVSSRIKLFNPKSLVGITRSETLYVLEGPSAYSLAAQAVWLQWCAKNGVTSWRDATADYLEQPASEGNEHSIAEQPGSAIDQTPPPE
jgi:hypothetical protein